MQPQKLPKHWELQPQIGADDEAENVQENGKEDDETGSQEAEGNSSQEIEEASDRYTSIHTGSDDDDKLAGVQFAMPKPHQSTKTPLAAFPGNSNADGVVHQKFQHSIRTRFLRFVPLDWNHSGRIGMRVEVYGCVYRNEAFPGNSNADGVVHQKFQHSIRTQFLRFVPLDWNHSGRIGMRVEVYGCVYKSDVADFNGRSSLLYRFNQKSMSTVKDVISLKFKSMQSDGVLVHGEGQRGDYITLELHRGKLALHINLETAFTVHQECQMRILPCDAKHKSYSSVSSKVQAFPGNSNADGVVHQKFQHSIRTRFLRFVPLDWNHSGRIGMRVEVYGCVYKSDVADFNGRSSLLYRFNQKSMSTVKDVISLKFKSMQSDGVLVHGEGQRGDYITLELHRGKLALHINLDDAKLRSSSSSRVSVTLGSLLDDQHWHSVLIERFNKQLNFTVDKHTQHFRTRGDCDSLDIDYELSFGGIPLPGKPGIFLRKNFHGCIENLYYNGVNIINLAKRRKPQIYTVGNVTFSCSDPQMVPVTFLSSTSSYLLLPVDSQADGLSLRFQFRTWNREGLLLSSQLFQKPELLLLYLSNGKLKLTHQKSLLEKTELTTGHGLNDGLWHTVSLSTRGLQVSLTLDNDASSTMEANLHIHSGDSYFFGGCPSTTNNLGCKNPTLAFQGCMRLIFINNQPMNLIQVQQGLLGNHSDLQIDLCGIRDRPPTPKSINVNFRPFPRAGLRVGRSLRRSQGGTQDQQGGTQTACPGRLQCRPVTGSTDWQAEAHGCGPAQRRLGFQGEQSSRKGERSNQQGEHDKVWTTMHHNSMELTRVQGSSLEKPYSMQFNYSTSREQLQAMVSGAEHCEQEILYRCKRSRLLNARDGTPFSWWVGRTSERQTYWSGSLPGVQQCSCGLNENCIDMNYFCNCDADRDQWANDTGLLSYKEHLPVNQMVIGDTSRTGSEAVYRVGPLRCYGDRNFWNAASFNMETSYLHFPTLHAELSADISFYFKTTAKSGVFLENMGIKDFIRIELSSPFEVTFSFDVGNGPIKLTVKSPTPLNDKQWHYVKAERNTKVAWLQVDQLPVRFLEAPADGHFRLQLNSQLFVGGTASRQKGFLGCVRSLILNGLTLDLEERAKMTPGVQPGCPGHCSNYDSFCHNGGKCIEKYNGFSCDCIHSAYRGPLCKTESALCFYMLKDALWEVSGVGQKKGAMVDPLAFLNPLVDLGAGGREAVASEPALTPEHALTTEHNTAQRTPHDPPRRRAQFRARRIVV
ncbi:UNVERIFIED_CONTAM: hypothetical protein FKN15_023638 [Acipenser sinensis]